MRAMSGPIKLKHLNLEIFVGTCKLAGLRNTHGKEHEDHLHNI